MKLNSALATLSLTATISTAHSLLRGSSPLPESPFSESTSSSSTSISTSTSTSTSCLSITDEDNCNSAVDDDGLSCVWCKCSAVPSECLSSEQAKKVPAGVFDCATPNNTDASPVFADVTLDVVESDADTNVNVNMDADVDVDANADHSHTIHTDATYDGSVMTYTLTDAEVDGNFCDPASKSLSGYVDIKGSKYDDKDDKHLFYWFFEKRSSGATATTTTTTTTTADVDADDIPLILWLTGGPGCSSTLALLTENGPCSVTSDGTSTTLNPHSWTETAHMIWLDQPAGVGYSAGSQNDYNEEMISEDAFYFLQGFFKAHPEYQSNPLFVFGESYGGHYAPAIAHKVFMKNQSGDSSLIPINLSGLAVGNGLTHPEVQYKYYPDMVYKNSHGLKVVSQETYDAMQSAVPKCVKLIHQCNAGDSIVNKFACQSAFVLCNVGLTSPYQMTGLNPYDIRKKCGAHPLCYDFTNIEKFLNLSTTKAALNVKPDAKWATCNMGINLKFHTDWMKDFSPFVKDLINAGIPSLIYAGDVDFICNYLGNRAWTLDLEWDHKAEFNAAEEKEWGQREDGSAAGLARTANGLTFLQVYDAGHMVPSDQPYAALEMVKNFLEGGDF